MEQSVTQAVLPGATPNTPPTGAAEFIVHSQDLLKELSELQKVASRKPTVPILANVLVQATGRVLALTASDLDVSLRTVCPALVQKEGSCTIPAHKLYEYVRLLEPGDVAIRVLANGWVQMKSGRSHTKMVGLASENFPALPLFPAESAIKLESSALRNMIAKTIFAIANEESRYILNGALLLLNAHGMTMVATDGHRMAHAEYGKPHFSQEVRLILPKKALAELNALLSATAAENIQFAHNDSTIFFAIGSRLITCRQLSDRFPNYEAVLPKDNKSSAVLAKDELFTALQRVSQFSDERSNAIRIRLANHEFKVSSSNTETGESEDVVQTDYTGEPALLAFNSLYLLEFLKAVGSTSVRLEFKDGQSASELKPAETSPADCAYRYVVMPLRI